MTEFIMVRYTRKPESLYEIESVIRYDEGTAYKTQVIETKEMTQVQYDEFVFRPLASRPWLAGKGGWMSNEVRLAIAVTAPGRRILYVDPEGSDYGRYIGMDISMPRYLDVRVNLASANGDPEVVVNLCRAAAQKAGVLPEDIKNFTYQAKATPTDKLLVMCQRWFDCY